MLRAISKIKQSAFNWPGAGISTTTKLFIVEPIDPKSIIVSPEEIERKKALEQLIEVPAVENVGVLTGVPEEHIKSRRVRIYIPAKNAMQSGTNSINHWELEFDTRQRWENPLMGWTSSGDPHSNLKLEFRNQDEAIDYCERHGYHWYLDSGKLEKSELPKNYGVNFSWNKRTRVSTK